MLRMAFGGSPANPSAWTKISKMVTDLSNKLLVDKNWDPKEVFPPFRMEAPEPKQNGRGLTFAPARTMAYKISMTIPSRMDDFVDNLINGCVDDKKWLERGGISAPLAVHVTSQPHKADEEPVKRRPNLSPAKVAAEGTHAKVQTVLGWELDGRALLCILPLDKYLAWSGEMREAMRVKLLPIWELESLIGKLVHASFVLPLSQHFLGQLRHKADTLNRQWGKAQLSSSDVNDLKQFLVFFNNQQSGKRGVTQLTCPPETNKTGCLRLVPSGAGKVSVLRKSLREGSKANNVLEFLVLVITAWIMCKELARGEHDCLLLLADGTCAIGWIFHTGKLNRNLSK